MQFSQLLPVLILWSQASTYRTLSKAGFSKAKSRLSYISSGANVLGNHLVLSLWVNNPISAPSSLSEQQACAMIWIFMTLYSFCKK